MDFKAHQTTSNYDAIRNLVDWSSHLDTPCNQLKRKYLHHSQIKDTAS